jgi:hypothetical protein
MNGRGRLVSAVRHVLTCPETFSRLVLRRPLRPYQLEPARAILDSILNGRGATFAIIMSRQAGKNELSGQLEAYLLNLHQTRGGQIVKASPTFKPQTLNSIYRLLDRLDNPWNRNYARRSEGYMVQLGRARCLFFSADPTANVVGATADILLEADEAQEIHSDKWYKDFAPMAASTNATTVFYGTAWTSDTLLARTTRHLEQQQRRDGIRRVFRYDAGQVAEHLPAYGAHVHSQVDLLGRHHPLIRTQYYLEEIDAQGGLFPPQRRALMRGDHPRQHEPTSPLSGSAGARRRYALLLDVAGEEEQAGGPLDRLMLQNPRRDATALTVVDVEIRAGALPVYRTVDRRLWLGVKHTTLHDQIRALAEHWRAAWVVVDATGIGAGLASFLVKALERTRCAVIPVVFSTKTKSNMGWNFVAAVETGRYRDYLVSEGDAEPDTRQFWYEVERCQYEVLPGPGERIRWGVWDSPSYDGLIAHGHDDLLISASLCTVLDEQDWTATGTAEIVRRTDPLQEIDRSTW